MLDELTSFSLQGYHMIGWVSLRHSSVCLHGLCTSPTCCQSDTPWQGQLVVVLVILVTYGQSTTIKEIIPWIAHHLHSTYVCVMVSNLSIPDTFESKKTVLWLLFQTRYYTTRWPMSSAPYVTVIISNKHYIAGNYWIKGSCMQHLLAWGEGMFIH